MSAMRGILFENEQDAALDARPRDWNFGIYCKHLCQGKPNRVEKLIVASCSRGAGSFGTSEI